MEVVTATGQRFVASPQEHQQLFWALRGAGHVGLCVVVRTQVKLHTLREKYVGGRFCYLAIAATKLGEFLHDMNEFCKEAEDEISFNIYLIKQIPSVAVDYFYMMVSRAMPKENSFPFYLASRTSLVPRGTIVHLWTARGKKEQLLTKNTNRFGAEPVKMCKMWKSALLRELTPEIIQTIINQLASASVSCNPHTIGLELFGGEINRRSRDSCAHAHRDALFLYSAQAMWKPEDDANAHACRQWAVTAGQSLLAHSLGSYQNYADCTEATIQRRLENYFGKSNLERIKDVKDIYDPYGLFTKEHFEL